MAQTMQAFRLLDWQQPPALVEVDVPAPRAGQVVVAVAGNGLCHSDVTMGQVPAEVGAALDWQMPFTLGHEIGGLISAVGAGVSGVAEGDPVALLSPHSCGACRQCAVGRESACVRGLAGRGYGRDGGLAAYVLVDSVRDVLPLGGLDPAVAGPLTDAGATSHHAVARVCGAFADESTAVVIGAGGLGAFAIQILRAISPGRVVAVDTNPARLGIATELGAHDAISGVDEGTAAAIRQLTGSGGAAAVLDFVGTDETIAAGLAMVEPGGSFGLVGAGGGSFRQPWFGGLPRDVEVFTFQGSDIADARAVIELAADGRIKSEIDRFPLERVTDAYDALEAGTLRGRAVVVPKS